MSWPRELHCPVCGSTEVDMRCAATVLLELNEIREDGGFTVNFDDVFNLHKFHFECHMCRHTDGGLDYQSAKLVMRKWSVKVEAPQ